MKTLLILLFVFLSIPSVLADTDRFPTFEELKDAEAMWWKNEGAFEKSLEIQSRLRLTSKEIENFSRSNNYKDLFLVFNQADISDPLRIASLQKAIKLHPRKPLIAFQAINHCSFDDEEMYKFCNEKLFEVFFEIDKNNMVSHFTLAARRYQSKDYTGALKLLKSGNKTKEFNSYIQESFNVIYNKSISLKFPNYIANRIAFSSMALIMYTNPLLEMCKNQHKVESKQFINECIKVGNRIEEKSNTLIEKILGAAIQEQTLIAHGGSKEDIKAATNRKQELSNFSEKFRNISPDKITRDIDSKFFLDFIKVGEEQAIRNHYDSVR